jgi:2-iminobutanoate/2-iminopropanoate deaminase
MKRFVLIALGLAITLSLHAQDRATVTTDKAPKAIGPYSQAVVAAGMVFASGQLGLEPASGQFVQGGISEQTTQALENLKAVLNAAGSSLERVVSCTVYMKDLNEFAAMNTVYAKYFPKDPPSRATVQVARLPKDGLVEISCIAVKP